MWPTARRSCTTNPRAVVTSSEYKRVRRSKRWQQLKYRRLIVADFKCEDCGVSYTVRTPRQALRYFHLHHVNGYTRLGEELISDVRIYCPVCHDKPGRHPWKEW